VSLALGRFDEQKNRLAMLPHSRAMNALELPPLARS
jgi:hypothetical protein